MTPPALPGYQFRIGYGAADDRLHGFYIPALERSVRFDRATGFFSSAALAIAAAGLVRLIANGGRMRLLCGAKLPREDVEAAGNKLAFSGSSNHSINGWRWNYEVFSVYATWSLTAAQAARWTKPSPRRLSTSRTCSSRF